MDNDSIIRHVDDIEQKIEQFIGNYAALKKDNSELIEKIERLEQALQEASEAITQYNQERELVRSRIDGLLTRLEAQSDDALNSIE